MKGIGTLVNGSFNARFNEKTFISRAKRTGWLISGDEFTEISFLISG